MPDGSGEFKIESFIQTDAAVNPGNSGGALVNKKGELVGINTAIVSQTGSYSGYSFAVPVNIVKRVVDDLIDYGSVKRAMLGISMGTVDKKIADEMKLSSVSGVYIYEVSKGSAADKAGLRKDDVIIAIDGQKITDASSVQAKVSGYHPGDTADIAYVRDGKTSHVTVVFQAASSTNGEVGLDGTTEFYGAKLKAADPQALKALGLKAGVEIVSLGSGKMADAGAREGGIIAYVNGKSVSKPEEVVALAKKADRAIYVEGVDKSGRSFYFGFGK
jgi:S1-C subfamily serine protease